MKMQCVECKNIVHIHKVATWRSGRTNSRCYKCGCPALEPYQKPERLPVDDVDLPLSSSPDHDRGIPASSPYDN